MKQKKKVLFRYQLSKWLKDQEDLREILLQLGKYNEPFEIKKKKERFAVFTRGLNIKEAKYFAKD